MCCPASHRCLRREGHIKASVVHPPSYSGVYSWTLAHDTELYYCIDDEGAKPIDIATASEVSSSKSCSRLVRNTQLVLCIPALHFALLGWLVLQLGVVLTTTRPACRPGANQKIQMDGILGIPTGALHHGQKTITCAGTTRIARIRCSC